jgi:hypothetical protein
VEEKAARGAVRHSGARGSFHRPARRTEGVGDSMKLSVSWSKKGWGVDGELS